MTQRVTFLVAFDLPAKVAPEVARQALKETVEEALTEFAAAPEGKRWGQGNVVVVHHPTVRRGE